MPVDISQGELKRIVERAQNGSDDDFYRLYSIYSKPIYNFIWRLVGSTAEAEDLTQETFLKVHSELRSLREAGQFRFWLFRIARNEVYQLLRKAKRKTEVSIEDEDLPFVEFLPDKSSGLDPEVELLSRELNEVIRQSLSELKPKYRDVFVLAVFEKMSYEDVAGIVGRSLLSVKTDIYRARLAIKERINAYLGAKKTK
jgi:RNA polymerase sigma-70 factor (ECF subfamily)